MNKKLLAVFVLSLLVGCSTMKMSEEKKSSTSKDNTERCEYIRDWLICGPFPGRALTADERKKIAASGYRHTGRLRGGLLVDYLKSVGGEASIHPTEGATVKRPDGKSIKWKKFSSNSDIISIADITGVSYSDSWPHHFAVIYGYTTIYSPTEKTMYLEIGTDDSGKVYHNGKLVYKEHALHCTMHRDFIPIKLKKGKNTLLVKLENCGGPGGFITRLLNKPPTKLVKLSRDQKDFKKKHNQLIDFFKKHGYKYTLTNTSRGDALVYSIYPCDYSKAHLALSKAIKEGKIQVSLIK